MSKYENPRTKQEESKGPHEDYEKNSQYYTKMLEKVVFIKDHDPTISRHVENPMYASFPHGEVGKRKGCYIISFHQNHSSFRRELCDIFNELGYKGLLNRHLVDPDDKWGRR